MRRLALVTPVVLTAVLVGLCASVAVAQNSDLYDLYQKRDLQGCLDGALARLLSAPEDRDLNHLVGRCLVEIGRTGEARPYLEKVVHGHGPKDWRYGYSLVNLGIVKWWEEDRDGARETWTVAAIDPDLATVTLVAESNLKLSGLAPAYADWTDKAGQHVHCRFAPGIAAAERDAFAARADETWARLAAFFGGQPDRRAEVLVWQDEATAKQEAGVQMLGFSFANLWVAHTRLDLPLGKYLAPVFMQWVSRPTERSPFLAAGVAEACDGRDGIDRVAEARAALAAAPGVEADIPRWWQDHRTIDWLVARPIAGALVQTLLDRGGQENFRLLLHTPTYVHAREIYGKDQLDAILADFAAALQAK